MRGIYKNSNWKSLDEISRAQLLLVIEGLKRGTIIRGNWTSFTDILKKAGLDYKLNSSRNMLNPVMIVAKTEDLVEANHRYVSLPTRIQGDEFHKINGWLLGYPECCTEEYAKERTPEQRRAQRSGQRHLSCKFGLELEERIRREGAYPEVLDYRPPSFTPCGIDCPDAIRVLRSWQDAVDALDPEAGKELVYFNRKDFPERLVHREYLMREHSKRLLEYRLDLLRFSYPSSRV